MFRNTIKAPLIDTNTREPIGQDLLLKIGTTNLPSISIEVGYSPKGSGRNNAKEVEVKISDLNNGFGRLVNKGMLILRYGDNRRITIISNADYYTNDEE